MSQPVHPASTMAIASALFSLQAAGTLWRSHKAPSRLSLSAAGALRLPLPHSPGSHKKMTEAPDLLLLLIRGILVCSQTKVPHFQLHVLIDEEVACETKGNILLPAPSGQP